MASVVANIAKGRGVELYNNVDTASPANSAFIQLVLATGGDPLATLQDYNTVADVLAGPSNEVTNVGYARKTITGGTLSAWAPDDSINRILLTFPTQTYATISAGDVWDIVVLAYDPDTTAGTDSTLVPITFGELRIDGLPISHTGGNTAIGYPNGWWQSV